MAIFVVISEPSEHDQNLPGAISSAFPRDHIKITDRTWLIAAKNSAEEISDKLGISKETSGEGLVFKITDYYGFADMNIWEWIKVKWEETARG